MRLDLAFRLSSYVTLGLSCLCLGYSELPLIEGIGPITAAVLALLAIRCWAERRWTLSLGGANLVGFVLCIVLVLWAASHVLLYEDLPSSFRPLIWLLGYMHEFGGPLLKDLPFPLGQLPYFGLLLMVLTV